MAFLVVCVTAVTLVANLQANNVQISDVRMVDAGGGQVDITFDLSWDNSWREVWTEEGGTVTVENGDAVWIFIKYRQTGGQWKHVKIQAGDAMATGDSEVEIPEEGSGRALGAFVYRATLGAGSLSCPDMSLRWDIVAEGLPSADEIDLAVMAIEMVYIPDGDFVLGSGGTELNHFHDGSDVSTPFAVTGEGEIAIGTEAGQLSALGALDSGSIPAAFPKGHAAFYCMKYEITEEQYVTFLNLLDPAVAVDYFPDRAGSMGHTIAEAAGGGYETTAPDRAVGFLSGPMTLDYLDWAALRPMTELEFEKVCRGGAAPWINEFPWGNATAVTPTSLDGSPGSGQETALPAEANIHVYYNQIDSPLRAGIFAESTSTRSSAGAGYYGVMNLGGNLQEVVVSAYHANGRAFTGAHGDGNEYTAHSLQWPAYSIRYVYAFRGSGYRLSNLDRARTSDRYYMASEPFRYSNEAFQGARGVRTAP